MKKTLLRTMLLLFALITGSSSVWAGSYTIFFKTGSGDGSTASTSTACSTVVSEGDSYLSGNLVTATNVYYNGDFGLKLGKSSGAGTIKMNLASAVTPTSIVVKAKLYNSSKATTLKVNGSATQDITADFSDLTFNITSNTTYLELVSSKYCWIKSITVNYAGGEEPEEREVTFSYTDYQGWANSPDYGKEITMSKTDVDITNNWFYTPQGYSYIQFTATNGNGTITITPKNGATITQVEFLTSAEYNGYQNDQTIIASTGSVSKNYEGTIVTWEGEATAAFTLRYNSHIHWTKIIVTYSGGTPVCATPVISGTTPFTASTTVSISCATEGATVEFCMSTDGVNFSVYQPAPNAPFVISQTTTVRARATKEGMDPSEVASKTFTQQVTENIAGIASSGASDQYVRLVDALVTYKNGTTAYLEDASGAIILHQCVGEDLAAGDKINGFMHVTNYTLYNKLPEVKAFELAEGYTKTSGNAVTPTVVTIADLVAAPESSPYEMYLSKYVKIENATVTSAFASKNCTIQQGGQTIILRDQNSSATLTSTKDDVITVTGHVAIYGDTKQIALYEQSQISAGTAATIAVTSNAIEAPFAGKDGTINVTYNNITTVAAEVLFFESDGTTPATYDWVVAEINNTTNNLDYVIDANTGAARTAYLKIHALDDELKDVYSPLITITQAVFVPDYATLPFTFANGRDKIASTNGLTQNGLGTDYSKDPKLKFDNTGDYLVLKINEEPGMLSFYIKGNDFADGTFKVQTSTDGETYSDLATFTEISDAHFENFDLAADVRYVKWIYTKKVSGNVGIGLISLAKPIIVTVGEAGYTTFWSEKPLSFEGVKAYIVTDFSGGNVTLKEISEAPYDTPVIIEASEGAHKLKQISSAAPVEGNKLQASRGSTRGGDAPAYDIYVLAEKNDKIGFYKLGNGIVVPDGKCYLEIKKSTGAPDYLAFYFGDVTGVNDVRSKMADVRGEVYDLQGRKVAQPSKGLYIVNGKKIVIK